jgi:hypothetical protein
MCDRYKERNREEVSRLTVENLDEGVARGRLQDSVDVAEAE